MHGEGNAIGLVVARLAVEQGQAGQEAHAGTAGAHQLLVGLVVGVGFADDLSAEYGDLVGANDQVVWMAVGECLCLFQGQALDQFNGDLAGAVAFVDVG